MKSNKSLSPYPSYLSLGPEEVRMRGEELFERLRSCDICPRNCFIDRLSGKRGVCRSDQRLIVSSYNLHFGEEPPISGWRGSGTIFFTNCPMRCKFCQNYPISQLGNGRVYKIEELSDMMLYLQKRGAHNINLVTPTHYLPHILLALSMAMERGLKIPIVYNTSGYEKVEILKFLDRIVDIYLPDAKYSDKNLAKRLSLVEDYPEVNKLALKEMAGQVGKLELSKEGIALKGLIIRHLVLPNNVENSIKVLEMIKEEIGTWVTISLMSQYFPTFRALSDSMINRKITNSEYERVARYIKKLGFKNGWIQPI